MTANGNLFNPSNLQQIRLQAGGFGANGSKNGGIENPVQVTIPNEAVLYRFQDPTAIQLGNWWTTGHELQVIIDHFGRGGHVMPVAGQNRGAMHAAAAVLPQWSTLGSFHVIRTKDAISAMHGDASHAGSDTYSILQKVALIVDGGHQRRPRQLFIPGMADMAKAYTTLAAGRSPAALEAALRNYPQGALYFEL